MYIAGAKQTIDTGDSYFKEIDKLSISGSEVARQQLTLRPSLLNLPIHDSKPIEARIEYSRWIVDCPNCGNGSFAFEDKLFLCFACGNSDIEGQVRKVKMPPQRKEIEDILTKRHIINRHWETTETVDELRNENLAHGLEV